MSIPVSTTTITIRRPPSGDPYETGDNFPKVAEGIRAHIGSPSGADAMVAGDRSVISARLDADPCDLRSYDRVQDETTTDVYDVVWLRNRVGLGLDHVEAGLSQVVGAPGG